eukprot:5774660-Prymnesium_polylepis.2
MLPTCRASPPHAPSPHEKRHPPMYPNAAPPPPLRSASFHLDSSLLSTSIRARSPRPLRRAWQRRPGTRARRARRPRDSSSPSALVGRGTVLRAPRTPQCPQRLASPRAPAPLAPGPDQRPDS